jgi:alpha-1,2-mannosyltransferase
VPTRVPRSAPGSGPSWYVLATAIGLLALTLRLVPVLRGGGLFGLGNYDDGVYFAAATAAAHGLLPYHDFLLLHPPGIVLVLLPFGLLGRLVGDPTAFAAARLAWMTLGAVNALLVGQILRPVGLVGAGLGALCYAVSLPAVYSEHTTLLEGPAQTCVLLAVLLVRPREARLSPTARAAVGAGVLLGASATVKIWGVVPVLVVVGWFVGRHALRTAAQVLGGAAVAVALVCLPFFVAAPVRMWQMVVLDQLGRQRSTVSEAARLGDMAGFALLGPPATGFSPLLVAGLVVVAVLLLLAWALPVGRLATVLTLVLAATLLASPSWFLHYPDLVAGPLCVALGAAAQRLVDRAGAVRRGLGVATVVLLVAAALAQAYPLLHFRPGTRFPGASLGRAAAAGRCITSDDPAALIEMDVLGRDLRRGCRFVADIGGYSYEVARLAGHPTPRRQDAVWHLAYLDYLRSGDLSLPFRYVRDGALSAPELAAIGSWPVVVRVGAYQLRRPAPAR